MPGIGENGLSHGTAPHPPTGFSSLLLRTAPSFSSPDTTSFMFLALLNKESGPRARDQLSFVDDLATVFDDCRQQIECLLDGADGVLVLQQQLLGNQEERSQYERMG